MATSDSFYNNIIAEISPIFDELGTTYTIRTPDTYNETELEAIPGSSRTVSGLVADQQTVIQLTGASEATWVATKTLILKQDAVPLPNEEIQVDSKWFPLSKVIPIKPADVTVLYLLDVSR